MRLVEWECIVGAPMRGTESRGRGSSTSTHPPSCPHAFRPTSHSRRWTWPNTAKAKLHRLTVTLQRVPLTYAIHTHPTPAAVARMPKSLSVPHKSTHAAVDTQQSKIRRIHMRAPVSHPLACPPASQGCTRGSTRNSATRCRRACCTRRLSPAAARLWWSSVATTVPPRSTSCACTRTVRRPGLPPPSPPPLFFSTANRYPYAFPAGDKPFHLGRGGGVGGLDSDAGSSVRDRTVARTHKDGLYPLSGG